MTAVIEQPITRTEPRSRLQEVSRIVRLHAVNPAIFFGVPWIILGAAWAVSMVVGIIITGAGGGGPDLTEGMRYSWAVLSPQWYLVVVGVQAVGLTFSFALGFGAFIFGNGDEKLLLIAATLAVLLMLDIGRSVYAGTPLRPRETSTVPSTTKKARSM